VGDFNATFLGEILTFMVLVWVTMKYVWPPIIKAINDRQKQIADGLEAAERGKHDLELAREKSLQILRQAKNETQGMLDQANDHIARIIENGKKTAKEEGLRLLHLAQSDITREKNSAALELQKQTATLALQIAEKFLHTQTISAATAQARQELLNQLTQELQSANAKQ
jgi:F-type H+-transporting ATPase subunit b